MTAKNSYFVEYLIGSLILSDSITEAMQFDCDITAGKFKIMLWEQCELLVSVNTYI